MGVNPGAPDEESTHIEMRPKRHTQLNLHAIPDPSYDETDFGGTPPAEDIPLLNDFIHAEDKPGKLKAALEFIRRKFKNADFGKIDPIGFSKKTGNETELVTSGKRGGETSIFRKDGKGLLQGFINKFQGEKGLGKPTEEIIAEDRITELENKQRADEAEKQFKDFESKIAQKEKLDKETKDLREKMNKTQARIDEIYDEHGSSIEMDAEMQRLKQLKNNYQTDFEHKKKEAAALEKQIKEKEKIKAKAERDKARYESKKRETDILEERLNTTKTLDELKERNSELKGKTRKTRL